MTWIIQKKFNFFANLKSQQFDEFQMMKGEILYLKNLFIEVWL